MRSIQKLEFLYSKEINFKVKSDWDAGYIVFLGDSLNGYIATYAHNNLDRAIDGLFELAKKNYPLAFKESSI